MPRGGYRVGAGRPVGTGCRKKSKKQPVQRKVIPLVEMPAEEVAKVLASGQSPLEYMLRVMRNGDADQARRDRMAMAAAPYCHARAADAKLGKKEQAEADAKTAGQETGWGEDLAFRGGHPN